MKKVLIAQKFPEDVVTMFEGRAALIFSPEPNEETVAKLLPDCDAVLVRTATKLGRETLSRAGKIKLISRTGAGVDNIDVEAASDNGIMVCNTPFVNTRTVAEHTLTLILCVARNLVRLNEETRKGNWSSRDNSTGMDLYGKSLGLLGFGRIGQMVAGMAKAFGMEINFYDPGITEFPRDCHRHENLIGLLKNSDILSLHLPLVERSRGIIGADEIAAMKRGSFIINTSRGGLIDENALLQAIKNGYIRAAGLDVFENEPVGKDNPLCKEERIIITPHAAALTPECRTKVVVQAIRNILTFFEGGRPSSIVNPEASKDNL